MLFFTFHFSLLTFSQSWAWGRQGTTGSDTWGVGADNKGNAFLTGYFIKAISFGTHNLNSVGSCDYYLVKYDSLGNIAWTWQSNSASSKSGAQSWNVTTDKAGNSFVTGLFVDTTTFGATTLRSSTQNAFLAKYNSSGSLQWVRQSVALDNSSTCEGYTVTTDTMGNVYEAGFFQDSVSFGPFKLHTVASPFTLFLVKYDAGGNVLWARQSTNPYIYSQVAGACISADNNNNVYISGGFSYTLVFGKDSLKGTGNDDDAFIVKYDGNGNELWAKQSHHPPGFSTLSSNWVVTDAAANAYITGSLWDTAWFDKDTLRCISGGMFLVKYSPAGNVIWAKQSTSPSVIGYSIAADANNHLFLSGSCNGLKSLTYDSYTLSIPKANDAAFIMELDTSGHAFCGSMLRSGGDDNNQVACSPSGRFVYMGGDIDDTVIFNKDTLHFNFINEPSFIARWQSCCPNIVAKISSVNVHCASPGSATVTVTDTSNLTYVWAPSGGTNATASNLSAGTYTVTLTYSSGPVSCSQTISVKVGDITDTAAACCSTTITQGQSAPLTVTPAQTYVWTPSAGLSCDTCQSPVASPTVTTWYYVTVTDSNACINKDSVLIIVQTTEKCGAIFVPDAFSPNNDGQNDVLYARGNCLQAIDFVIYDRWGNKVFETENINEGWDGLYAGKPENTGTYAYYLKVLLNDGSLVEKKGNITLVR